MKHVGKEHKDRGEFIAAETLKEKFREVEGITEGDITLTAKQVRGIWNDVICPCGQCQFYSVELFQDGNYVVHHHTKGVMSKGNFLN